MVFQFVAAKDALSLYPLYLFQDYTVGLSTVLKMQGIAQKVWQVALLPLFGRIRTIFPNILVFFKMIMNVLIDELFIDKTPYYTGSYKEMDKQ